MLIHIISNKLLSSIERDWHTRTPQRSSRIFSGIFQWMFSGVLQRIFNVQRHVPKDFHLSSGSMLELFNGVSVAFSDGCSFVGYLVCNLSPRSFLPMVSMTSLRKSFMYIYIYIYSSKHFWFI